MASVPMPVQGEIDDSQRSYDDGAEFAESYSSALARSLEMSVRHCLFAISEARDEPGFFLEYKC